MNNVAELLNRLGLSRIAAMGVVAALMMGFFAFLILRVTSPQLAPLYSGMTFEDSAAIVSELQTSGTTYEIRGDGDTILVPRDEITTIRMRLAQDGLPTRGQVGYEIFDQQSTLGATSFVQDINLIRALEGELARTIISLSRVQTARVHLVLPKRELFRRERQDPTASIALGTRGTLSSDEIRAVQHMVASAVEGMNPNQVSIVDQSGRLLAAGGSSDDVSAMTGQIEERTIAVETRLTSRLEELLANIVGPGRARVQVSAELETDRSTVTSETFNPEGQVVRSVQTRDLTNTSNASAGGSVSVGSDIPSGGGSVGGASDQSATTEETVNYEISHSTETVVSEAGAIKSLSVAVVVDGVYSQDAAGVSTYEQRTVEQMDQIRALVNSTIGFNADRGDQVEVVNMQFAERPDLGAIGTEGPGLFDFTKDDILSTAEMVVTILISLALVLFVMRPLIKRVLEPEAPMELAAGDEIAPGIAPEAIPAGEPLAVMDNNHPPEWMDQAKQAGQAKTRTLDTVGGLVEENPKQSSVIVRDWLQQAAA